MAKATAGVVTAVEVNGPIANGKSNGNPYNLKNLFHPQAPATWAFLWFIVACLLLFFI